MYISWQRDLLPGAININQLTLSDIFTTGANYKALSDGAQEDVYLKRLIQ